MIKITKNSKLFIWGNTSEVMSGGAEVLNMLGSKLKSLGVNCGLFNWSYKDYYIQNPFYTNLYDINCWNWRDMNNEENTIVLLPDLMIEGLKWIEDYKSYKNRQYIIWWLGTGFDYADMTIKTSKRKELEAIKELEDRCLHLCESELAMRDLLYHGVENRIIFQHPVNEIFYKSEKLAQKENIVFYNGLKKYNAEFVETYIIPRLPNIQFRCVNWNNLISKEELRKEYDKAKVYIDFCEFEGREMMPREACLRDCILILGNNGNAATFDDYPIPSYYKEHRYGNIDTICEKISDCVFNYQNHINDMNFIKNKFIYEPMKFEWELRNVFGPMIKK